LGLAGSTLVVYTSDHGEMAGEHGLFQKFVLFDGSARVPLIVRCPWLRGPAGGVARAPVDLADVVPTCLDLCGVAATHPQGPSPFGGTSLAPLLREPGRRDASGKGFAFSEIAYGAGPAYLARAGRWKYVHYTGTGERALFDMEADPYEHRNLAATPAGAAEAEVMRRRLFIWLPATAPR
jgi:arylsulfatase A-like enzyme